MHPVDRTPHDNFQALNEHAEVIRHLGKRIITDVIEIGRRLVDCRDHHLEHGQWLPWLEKEFGWSRQTADRFIHVFEASGKLPKLSNLEIPISAIYLLTAPNAPPEAYAEVAEQAETGEKVSVETVKQAIDKHRKPAKAGGTTVDDAELAAHAAKMAETTIINGEPAAEIDDPTEEPRANRRAITRARLDFDAVTPTEIMEAWTRWSPEERRIFLASIPLTDFLEVIPEAWRSDLEDRILGHAPVERLIQELDHKLPAKARTALKHLKRALAQPTKVDPRIKTAAQITPAH
jgi:hypothetical protein